MQAAVCLCCVQASRKAPVTRQNWWNSYRILCGFSWIEFDPTGVKGLSACFWTAIVGYNNSQFIYLFAEEQKAKYTIIDFLNVSMQVLIHSFRVVAQFGMMHLVAANLCVWFRVIATEAIHELHEHAHTIDHGSVDHVVGRHVDPAHSDETIARNLSASFNATLFHENLFVVNNLSAITGEYKINVQIFSATITNYIVEPCGSSITMK